MEIWKDCLGYEGLYQVSNLGNVWSVKYQRVMKPRYNNHGYQRVYLKAKNGKYKDEYIHRLVALAFIPNPQNKPQVNHLNEVRDDNRADNLEWVTNKENVNYGNRAEKFAKAVGKRTMCVETGDIYTSGREAARVTGISQSHLQRACADETKTAGGYHWRYVS